MPDDALIPEPSRSAPDADPTAEFDWHTEAEDESGKRRRKPVFTLLRPAYLGIATLILADVALLARALSDEHSVPAADSAAFLQVVGGSDGTSVPSQVQGTTQPTRVQAWSGDDISGPGAWGSPQSTAGTTTAWWPGLGTDPDRVGPRLSSPPSAQAPRPATSSWTRNVAGPGASPPGQGPTMVTSAPPTSKPTPTTSSPAVTKVPLPPPPSQPPAPTTAPTSPTASPTTSPAVQTPPATTNPTTTPAPDPALRIRSQTCKLERFTGLVVSRVTVENPAGQTYTLTITIEGKSHTFRQTSRTLRSWVWAAPSLGGVPTCSAVLR